VGSSIRVDRALPPIFAEIPQVNPSVEDSAALKGARDASQQTARSSCSICSSAATPAVEAACAEVLAHGVHSADVVLNILRGAEQWFAFALRFRDAHPPHRMGPLRLRNQFLAQASSVPIIASKSNLC
jgi:hypothetical protein